MAGPTKVLIVDDDQDYKASVKSLLESEGYTVIEAECGKDGLQKLVEHKPDVIILDIMMESSVEGYCLNHAIKYQAEYAPYRNIPIIMVSSIDATPDERFPMSSEAEMIRPDWYLTKPLEIPRLLSVLKSAVAH